jgi:hypothetical protein
VTPQPQHIDAALDALDWMPPERIAALRGAMVSMIEDAARSTWLRGLATRDRFPSTTTDWDPVHVAILYVLWVTSDTYLERQMRRSHHVH